MPNFPLYSVGAFILVCVTGFAGEALLKGKVRRLSLYACLIALVAVVVMATLKFLGPISPGAPEPWQFWSH